MKEHQFVGQDYSAALSKDLHRRSPSSELFTPFKSSMIRNSPVKLKEKLDVQIKVSKKNEDKARVELKKITGSFQTVGDYNLEKNIQSTQLTLKTPSPIASSDSFSK